MKIIKINSLTIYLLFILLITGYIKVGIIILSIVLIHELGHIMIIKMYKYKICSINIYPFGGITNIEKNINTPTNREILIATGGVLMQLLLCIVINIINIDSVILNLINKYNINIMLFNLLPIIPLDGSIVINALLNKVFSFKYSYYINIIISIIFIIIYIFGNYLYSLNNYLIISLFCYKTYDYYKNYRYIHNRFLLERYLDKLNFKYISCKKGNIDILKIDTYQYFNEDGKMVSERKKIAEIFDNNKYFW